MESLISFIDDKTYKDFIKGKTHPAFLTTIDGNDYAIINRIQIELHKALYNNDVEGREILLHYYFDNKKIACKRCPVSGYLIEGDTVRLLYGERIMINNLDIDMLEITVGVDSLLVDFVLDNQSIQKKEFSYQDTIVFNCEFRLPIAFG